MVPDGEQSPDAASGDAAVDPDRALHDAEPGWRARVVARSLAPAADRAVRRGQEFISAASDLVLRSSGDDFTVQQVAAEAGRTLRSFYQHFSGKDDLLIALIEESQVVMARLLTLQADRFEDPLERLGGALYWAYDERQHTAHDYNAALLRFAQRAAVTAPDRVGAARGPVRAVFARLIDEAMRAGAIEPGDPTEAAFTLMALHSSYTQASYLGDDPEARSPAVPALVRFCVLGLGARIPSDWEQRFVLSDEEANHSRRHSERIAADAVRRPEEDGPASS